MIYLDNAATTRPWPQVVDAMLPYFNEEFGNAGTLYALGRRANDAVRKARKQTARLFNCDPDNIIFNSGGSEGNSTVFRTAELLMRESGKRHILISAVEHDSVVHAAQALCADPFDGFEVELIPVDSDGRVQTEQLKRILREDTGLVSVMYVNNETGAVNDVEEVGKICSEFGILFHTDCVQAAGVYPIDVTKVSCDFATISGHKLHGPKGVGALYVRDPSALAVLIHGGEEQEFGLRGGTENVPGIVGLGEACEMTIKYLDGIRSHVSELKQTFYKTLLYRLQEFGMGDDVHVNGPSPAAPGKTLNLRFDCRVDAQTLVLMMDAKGVCISAGSACRSSETSPSRVLTAMGLTPEQARQSVRISFSEMNTPEEVERAANIMADAIKTLNLI